MMMLQSLVPLKAALPWFPIMFRPDMTWLFINLCETTNILCPAFHGINLKEQCQEYLLYNVLVYGCCHSYSWTYKPIMKHTLTSLGEHLPSVTTHQFYQVCQPKQKCRAWDKFSANQCIFVNPFFHKEAFMWHIFSRNQGGI